MDLFLGLCGDLQGDGADLELVAAEEVGVVGGGEVGGEWRVRVDSALLHEVAGDALSPFDEGLTRA